MAQLFTCFECNEKFLIGEFTAYNVCKSCYDRYWEEYTQWVEEQYQLQQAKQIYYEEQQIEG